MSDNPYESPRQPADATPPAGSWRGKLLSLAAILIAVVLLALLLLPAVRRTPREAARRMQCANNLKQIMLGLHNYVDEHHALPPAYTVDAQGRPLHSWRTLILPYVEQKALYDQIDLSKPWDDPVNAVALRQIPAVYRCPSTVIGREKTCYLAVVAPHGCFLATESRSLDQITDDHDSTLMVVEVDSDRAVPWMAPADADEAMILALADAQRFAHPGGANVVTVSGRVSFLPVTTPPAELRALVSIAGDDADAIGKAGR